MSNNIDLGVVRARQQQYLRERDATADVIEAEAEREAVTFSVQAYLRGLNATIPGTVTGSDADVRRLAEQIASLILLAR